MATHSSILAWRILWTEEPGGLQSMGSQRVRHNRVTNTFTVICVYTHTHTDTHTLATLKTSCCQARLGIGKSLGVTPDSPASAHHSNWAAQIDLLTPQVHDSGDGRIHWKKPQIHRLREQTFSCRGEGDGEGMVREFGMDAHTLLYF